MSDVLRDLVKANAAQFRDAALALEEHAIKVAKDMDRAPSAESLMAAAEADYYPPEKYDGSLQNLRRGK